MTLRSCDIVQHKAGSFNWPETWSLSLTLSLSWCCGDSGEAKHRSQSTGRTFSGGLLASHFRTRGLDAVNTSLCVRSFSRQESTMEHLFENSVSHAHARQPLLFVIYVLGRRLCPKKACIRGGWFLFPRGLNPYVSFAWTPRCHLCVEPMPCVPHIPDHRRAQQIGNTYDMFLTFLMHVL